MTKIYIIAGEVSGDYIGSNLITQLKKDNLQLQLFGIGGKLMIEAGLAASLFPINAISLMGFFEVIPHICRLNKLINSTVADIIRCCPDLLITIDSPGFTYRVAREVRGLLPNLKMLHIVAPSVWAYKPGRALKYARIYNYLFALLPFEPPYFQKVGLDCRYIGHPILEQKFYHDKLALREELKVQPETKLICVTMGSRKGEIIRHLPVFCASLEQVARTYPNIHVTFVLADQTHAAFFKPWLASVNFKFSFSTSDKLKVFAASDVALAKSGTNTIEIAASNTPMIVAYKLNIFSYFLIRLLIKVKYITLINIIASKEIIPEFIQFNCKPQPLAAKLISLLSNKDEAATQVARSREILKQLGYTAKTSPSKLASQIIKSDILKIV